MRISSRNRVSADLLHLVGTVAGVDLNPAQRRAVESDAQPLCILAGAGSGKTRVLTRRIAHRIDTGAAAAGHVVAVTFTRKAADELRTRLRALGIRDGVAAGTFHSLAYSQLRRRWSDRGELAPTLLDRKVQDLGPAAAASQPAVGRHPAGRYRQRDRVGEGPDGLP